MYFPEMEHIPENLIWTIEVCEDKSNIRKKLQCSILLMLIITGKLLPEAVKTFPAALEYAKKHLNEIPLGELEYIENSDVLDEENCEMETVSVEGISKDSVSRERNFNNSKRHGGQSSKASRNMKADWQNKKRSRCRKDCKMYGFVLSKHDRRRRNFGRWRGEH